MISTKLITHTLAIVIAASGAITALSMPAPAPVASMPLQDNQSEVSLTMTNLAKNPRVGVPNFLSPAGDAELAAAANTMAQVLWDDLQFEREYYMIERQVSAGIPATAPDAIPYARWADLGADFVLVASLTRSGGDIAVELRLMGVKGENQGKQRFGARYPNCRLQNVRGCAHAIADDLHKQDRGLDGVARTRIAFASDRQGTRVAGRPTQTAGASKEIYVADYDGANPMRVTVNGSINCCPAWSPTGGLLSFVSWASGVPDIYIANLAEPGRLGRPLSGNAAVQNWTPAWSPDGSKLAFASTRSGNLDIWVMNRDGSGLQNLTNSPRSSEGTPTWSPNGAQIAFTSDRAGSNQLYVMSATGTGVQLLVPQRIDRPTWSALNFIAFTVDSTSGHDIGIYDFSNPGGVKVITDGRGSNESPAVAPNGRHIAFVTTRWGKQHIATVDRTGLNIRQVTEVGNNTYPNWQSVATR